MITTGLRLLKNLAAGGNVLEQSSTDRAVMDKKLSGDLSSAHVHVITGRYLVSLVFSSVSDAMLLFGGEPRRYRR